MTHHDKPGEHPESHHDEAGNANPDASPDRPDTTQKPANPGGISSGLQPGGTVPGGGPGASTGSIGTGGGSTGGASTGSVKRSGV